MVSAPSVLTGNPTPVVAGSLVLLGNTIYADRIINEKETAADRNLMVMVQTARENGVDLLDGMPDNNIPTFMKMLMMRITNNLYEMMTKLKIPLPNSLRS